MGHEYDQHSKTLSTKWRLISSIVLWPISVLFVNYVSFVNEKRLLVGALLIFFALSSFIILTVVSTLTYILHDKKKADMPVNPFDKKSPSIRVLNRKPWCYFILREAIDDRTQ